MWFEQYDLFKKGNIGLMLVWLGFDKREKSEQVN